MPRQNLLVLVAVAISSVVCYRQADSAHRSERGRMFDTFSEVLKEVDEHYLRKVEDRQLFEGALQGMMGKLDPYSAYIPPDQYADLLAALEQKIGGIGIEIVADPETGNLSVVTPIADSPAYVRGIRAGDLILKIDGDSTKGWTTKKAVDRVRGRNGAVKLAVLHKGETEPVELTIERAMIPIHSVLGDVRDADNHWNFLLPGHEGIGYVRITTFGENTAEELKTALAWLTERNVRGLILDLRGNRGGSLDQAVAVCDLFVTAGRIVTTRGRGDIESESWDATGKAPYGTLPVVVLVNQHTASAAEIVAACLQDHHRAIIVGQRTWGKGTVQNVIQLEGGQSALKLTTASYRRPSGQDIHRYQDAKDQESWGVQPDADYEVKLTDAETAELDKRRQERDVVGAERGDPATDSASTVKSSSPPDPQLERALEALATVAPG